MRLENSERYVSVRSRYPAANKTLIFTLTNYNYVIYLFWFSGTARLCPGHYASPPDPLQIPGLSSSRARPLIN